MASSSARYESIVSKSTYTGQAPCVRISPFLKILSSYQWLVADEGHESHQSQPLCFLRQSCLGVVAISSIQGHDQ